MHQLISTSVSKLNCPPFTAYQTRSSAKFFSSTSTLFQWPDRPFERQFAPLTLTWICSRWRINAVSTPRLWDFYYIPHYRAAYGYLDSP
ncbi:hypothetical protein BT96DRAFT_462317 [Gymnopus androsaceus JB14]|uniref:Uncharacterized protein n=1 Tax=Gymnopus androsaceus JB14 TaxID=1447944 RepID=A0A6A4IHD0_9AGAR|nr:hypothetical protein BT96DRAFT_462317 [Gymnopus androsaceus JB14]